MKEKKELILRSVLYIIKENGLNQNIKISDIAKRAGIGKGTVYEYFKSKDEIIAEAIIYSMRENVEKYISKEYKNLDFENVFINHIKNVSLTLSENLNLHTLFVSQNIGSFLSEDMKKNIKYKIMEMRLEYNEIFGNLIKKGIEEGKIDKDIDQFHIFTAQTTILAMLIQFINKKETIKDIENTPCDFLEDTFQKEIMKEFNDMNFDEIARRLYKIALKILN
ncbi:TetR/AcrR family transcriptional regulator [Clostridium botulinum]|nr:TetR/AcrR family transcriptional regulator [Clostridium botulinum]